MSDSLRKDLIRLAHANAEVRPHILSLLKEASVSKKAIDVGQTIEVKNYRVHRFMDSVRVTDLTNAGKRGKVVETTSLYRFPSTSNTVTTDMKAAIESFFAQITRWPNYDTAKEEMLAFVAEFQERFQFEISVSTSTAKGVEVVPGGFKNLKIVTDKFELEAGYKDFTIRDREDEFNLPACIPAITGGQKDIPVFYRWVRDNEAAIKNMNYRGILKAMKDLGIKYHDYCSMD